jgi:hypothetical protein
VSSLLPVGHGVLQRGYTPRLAFGLLMPHREGRRYLVQSDELLSAFLELEATLLYSQGNLPRQMVTDLNAPQIFLRLRFR